MCHKPFLPDCNKKQTKGGKSHRHLSFKGKPWRPKPWPCSPRRKRGPDKSLERPLRELSKETRRSFRSIPSQHHHGILPPYLQRCLESSTPRQYGETFDRTVFAWPRILANKNSTTSTTLDRIPRDLDARPPYHASHNSHFETSLPVNHTSSSRPSPQGLRFPPMGLAWHFNHTSRHITLRSPRKARRPRFSGTPFF